MPKKIDMPSEEKAKFLFDIVEDRKAVDPVLLDLRGKTLLFDYIIICSGMSNVHIRAIAGRVEEAADERRLPSPRIEGEQVGEWILMDFGDIVLHIMSDETRERFRLEDFWTTPQPKGALPPTPSDLETSNFGGLDTEVVADDEEDDEDLDEDDLDDLDEEDLEDAAFFDEADSEVEPLEDEDDDDVIDRSKRAEH